MDETIDDARQNDDSKKRKFNRKNNHKKMAKPKGKGDPNKRPLNRKMIFREKATLKDKGNPNNEKENSYRQKTTFVKRTVQNL